MTEVIQDLEFMFEEGGWKSVNIEEMIGPYDIAFGYKKIFYIHNPNKLYAATLRDASYSDPTWIFHGPKNNEIFPLQTVKVMLEIPPDKEAEKNKEQFMDDILSGKVVRDLEEVGKKKVQFAGKIQWSVMPTLREFEKQLEKKFEKEKES